MEQQREPATTGTDRAGTFGELVKIAIPLVISASASALMYVIDRVFLSWDSLDAMAAALPAGVLHWNLAALGMGTVGYATAFVAQYHGAGQNERIGPVLWQGIYLSLLASVLVALTAPFAESIFAWFGHDSAIQLLEVRYYRIMAIFGTLPLVTETGLASFYSGRGRTSMIMVANLVGTSINAALDYLLIFGKWGFPKMGIDGAAIATSVAFASIVAMYVGQMVWQERGSVYALFAGWRFDRSLCARLLRFGLPNGIQQCLDIACWTVFVQLIGRLGKSELAATGLVFNLNALVFVPLMGLGTAVVSLVGQRVGEGRPRLAVRSTWMAFGLASAYVAAVSGVYVFAPDTILRPYGLGAEDVALRDLVIQLLTLVAIYSWFDSMTVVFSSAIRGAGDTRFALVYSFSMGLVFLVLPTSYAASIGPEGFSLAWNAVVVFITLLGLGFLARFLQGRWKTMKVIEHTAAEVEPLAPVPQTPHAVSAAAS